LVAILAELDKYHYNPLRFCVEASYRIPYKAGSWPSFYFYRSVATPSISDEIDVEQPVKARTDGTDVYRVYLHNHPSEFTSITKWASGFDINSMSYYNGPFDIPYGYAKYAHSYTVCYDNHDSNNCANDHSCTIDKYIDGTHIYTATDDWSWLGLTQGVLTQNPPNAIINLAVGGSFPGNVNPMAYQGNLDVYYIEYYGPP
jgi:hypothetical protein